MNREIFIRYFKGQISAEDEKILLDWIDSSDDNKREFIEARQAWDMILFSSSAESAPKVFRFSFRKITYEIGKVAAVVAIVSSIAFMAFNRYEHKRSMISQTIEAPAGQMVKITLPDGTKVWLNSKTKLRYSLAYGSDTRNVTLDGEAFFEVAHDARHPFIVSTSRYNIKALGTEFNVYAYSESGNNRFSASLLRGKVSVTDQITKDDVYLTPNMKAVIEDGKLKSVNDSTSEDMLWRSGIYSFNDMPLVNILERLERYYEVTIDVRNKSLLNYTCTGKFRKNEGINHILDVIKAEAHFNYIYDKESQKVVIYK